MTEQRFDVVIVGGGVMGAAAAYHLSKDGQRVLLLEQFTPNHGRGSSHGPSRIIRLAYETPDYVALARASYRIWRELEAESGAELMVQAGGVDLGTPDAMLLAEIRTTYQATDVAYEELDHAELARRFPQFRLPEGTIGLYQPDYSVLAADRCVQTMTALAQRHGATVQYGAAVRQVAADGAGALVTTDSASYRADRMILSAGSWMPPLLAQLGLHLPLTVTKEQLCFIRPADPAAYAIGRLPLAIHRFAGTTSLGSVFPTYGHAGVKVMLDRIGPAVAPEDPDRSIDQGRLDQVLRYAAEILPGLTGEVLEAVSCRYTMTPDEHFIIDRHPEHPQIVIASPCSGHGFKFGAVVGRVLADLATAGQTSFDIQRFRLDRAALR